VTDVQQHFEAVGFSLPPRMDLPSWLVEITTPAGAQQLSCKAASFRAAAALQGICMLSSSCPASMSCSVQLLTMQDTHEHKPQQALVRACGLFYNL
jgi:hypothetical protein